MDYIITILTCYNRCEKTINCIKSIHYENPLLQIKYVVVDDNSSDDTIYQLNILKAQGIDIVILHGTGDLYWSGGMRKGINYVLKNDSSKWVLLVNDDVNFFPHAIEQLLEQAEKHIMVGATSDNTGKLTYGGIRYIDKRVKYETIGPYHKKRECDTFNANCVLIPREIFSVIPNIDPIYKHSLGDLDYGHTAHRFGIKIEVANFFVGTCLKNPVKGSWLDRSLTRIERIKRKEQIKGAPLRPWFYYLKKNFGIWYAMFYTVTPYIKILMKL